MDYLIDAGGVVCDAATVRKYVPSTAGSTAGSPATTPTIATRVPDRGFLRERLPRTVVGLADELDAIIADKLLEVALKPVVT